MKKLASLLLVLAMILGCVSIASAEVDPDLLAAAQAEGDDAIRVAVSFFLPNTMDGEDTAEVECVMTHTEMKTLLDELDKLCEKFPDRA